MNIGLIHGIYTLVFMTAFIAFVAYVFSPRRKSQYDEAAKLDEIETGDSRRPDQGEHKKS